MNTQPLYDKAKTRNLLIPLVTEYILLSLMGMADTLMVANAGEAAVSAVSLVNSINSLFVQVLASLAIGGGVVISQLVGAQEENKTRIYSKQLLLSLSGVALMLCILCILLRGSILRLLYPGVEEAVMNNASLYLLITALSYPFSAIASAGSAVSRAGGDSRTPMRVSILANLINVAGNAIMIYGMKLGVVGAAIPTLLGRVFSAVAISHLCSRRDSNICINGWMYTKPDFGCIREMMRIGLPAGLEKVTFDLGKLMIQSIVSGCGTAALAANAIVITMESVTSKPCEGINMGLMIMVGTCAGAGRFDEAKIHIKRMRRLNELLLIACCAIVMLIIKPATVFANLSSEAAALAMQMCLFIHLAKPLFWVLSFSTAAALNGAGDTRFTMAVSISSMWLCRVVLCFVLYRYANLGPMAAWCGMAADWFVRGIIFNIRLHSGKWMLKAVTGKKQ